MHNVDKLCTVSTCMYSVYRLYSAKCVCAQCLQTMHSVYKLCTVSTNYAQCLHTMHSVCRLASIYAIYTSIHKLLVYTWCLYMRIRICAHTRIRVRVSTHIRIHVYMCIRRVYVAYAYTRIHIRIYMYTHINTYLSTGLKGKTAPFDQGVVVTQGGGGGMGGGQLWISRWGVPPVSSDHPVIRGWNIYRWLCTGEVGVWQNPESIRFVHPLRLAPAALSVDSPSRSLLLVWR